MYNFTIAVRIGLCLFMTGAFIHLHASSEADTSKSDVIIEGRIINHIDDLSLKEVEVYGMFSGGDSTRHMTDADGSYQFRLPQGANFSIFPHKEESLLKNVNIGDLISIQEHILEIDILTSPYDLVAADINKDGTINTKDMIEIREVSLGRKSSFTNNTSWRFFSDISGEEVMTFDDIIRDHKINFTGVKIGNVNPNESFGLNRSNHRAKKWPITNKELGSSQSYHIVIDVPTSIQAMEGTILYNPDLLDVTITNNSKIETNRIGLGRIRFITIDNNGQMDLKISAKQNIDLSAALAFVDVLAVNSSNEVIALQQDFVEVTNESRLSCVPNPAQDNVDIEFYVETDHNVTLTFYDQLGRTLRTISSHAERGYNSIPINVKELQTTGLIYYKLDSETFSATKKMIVLR